MTVSDDPTEDPTDDPDFISEDGASGAAVDRSVPLWSGFGSPTPVFVPKRSTPLAEADGNGVIPAFALWAMKYKRHGHLFDRAISEVRESIGSGDHAVYVIDDGRKHCMVTRKVGTDVDGCTYCLVGQVAITAYEGIVDAGALADGIFSEARELCLVAVFEAEQAVSNVSSVRDFADIGEVPSEYLPPAPPILFDDIPDGVE